MTDPKAVGGPGWRNGAILIRWGFEQYRAEFRKSTRMTQRHFEAADWHGVQRGAQERLRLYGEVVARVIDGLHDLLGPAERDPAAWPAMRAAYSELMSGHADLELAETFFNSVTRKVFTTVGVDAGREYVHLGAETGVPASGTVPARSYPGFFGLEAVARQVLEDYSFRIGWEDLARDSHAVAAEVERELERVWGSPAFDFAELLVPVFFRNKGAYLVGRVVRGTALVPFVLALVNRDGKVAVDAVLLDEDDVSIVFSFTRSYFHVDVEAPGGVIRFLRTLMPRKPVSELYIGIGYNKHGKTELYRNLLRHLWSTGDRFVRAPGERGMVMVVYSMPGYEFVFKIIRDEFGPAKHVTRAQVRERYDFVFQHDRGGRLVDIQEFEHLQFLRSRFEPSILEELLTEASQMVRLEGDTVVIRHLYTERGVTPLNLFVQQASDEAVRAAVIDLGQALRDLAATNIFPGDLLLKNFGVTRHGRVVFYDYDELCLVTDCDFRELPGRDEDDEGNGGDETSFYVGPRDVFPEEFILYMGLPAPLRKLFLEVHGDLVRPEFWNRMKERHASGEILDLFPYSQSRRLPVAPGAAGRSSAAEIVAGEEAQD